MDWNKRISSLDERETTLEYIEESTLLRVLSILSAFERRRRVIAVHSTKEVEETSAQFDEAEKAIERSLEAQQHTDTTTTTWVSLLVVLISHILHIIDATSPVFRPVFFFNQMKKLHNCELRHFQASLCQLKNSQIARNFARRTRTKVTVIWAKYNDEYSSFRTSRASNIAQLGVIIVFEKFWNF